MLRTFTCLRLPLLALLTSFALTSCFDHDKKCDPKPGKCCPKTPTTTPPTTGGAN